ncbi:hypothetical protein [Pseudonocardia sp. NPDC049635]|uniref:hypothetical protein n=1 Tax=Pseudonocardia sp. NPDC049635 TaxID=3155506 RepID=UPI0033D07213
MNTRGATTSKAKTQARKAAQDLLQARMRPITRLAELGVEVEAARTEIEAARERFRTTQEAYAEGYRAAREAGWSPGELEEIGCGAQPAGAALRSPSRRTEPSDDPTAADDDDANESIPALQPTDLDAAHSAPSSATAE